MKSRPCRPGRSTTAQQKLTMAAIDTYDAVVLGSGEAGKSIAWHLGSTGQRVVVVEQRYVGGSCPNIACLPSKNFIHSAGIAHTLAASEALGTRVAGRVSMREVQVRKRTMVEGLVQMHLNRFAASGCELVMGGGCFIAERTIEVALNGGGTRTLRGDRVFLDVGAFASLPALPGLAEAAPLTHVELLDLDTVPEDLLILGGSYVGLELAQAMRRLGSRVTVCERDERLLPREDRDIAEAVRQLLQDEGMAIVTSADVSRVSGRSGDGVALHAMIGGSQKMIEGSHLIEESDVTLMKSVLLTFAIVLIAGLIPWVFAGDAVMAAVPTHKALQLTAGPELES